MVRAKQALPPQALALCGAVLSACPISSDELKSAECKARSPAPSMHCVLLSLRNAALEPVRARHRIVPTGARQRLLRRATARSGAPGAAYPSMLLMPTGLPVSACRRDYSAPTGAVGRPDIQQRPVTIPPLGPDGGGGGSSGSGGGGGGSGRGGGGNGGRSGGGGGNGGNGGSWMRGPTYLYSTALLLGGLMAYFRRGSQKSLLFSAAAAILLLVAASLLHHRSGVLLALSESKWGLLPSWPSAAACCPPGC